MGGNWGLKVLRRGANSRLLVLSAAVGVVVLWLYTPLSVIAMIGASLGHESAVLAVLSRLPKAVARLREEQTRTAAERDAFEQFARRVVALEHSEPTADQFRAGSPPGGDTVVVPATETTMSESLETVRNAYRETIMAVAHYEEEYGESLEENMALEFGPELAESVCQGGPLTPQLQAALVAHSRQSRNERERFLQTLEAERENLVTARRSFRDIAEKISAIEESLHRRSARELIEDWKRLDDAEDTCVDVLIERQSALHDSINGRTLHELQSYLYPMYSWTYPVMNDGLDCKRRIQKTKHQTVDALSKWR